MSMLREVNELSYEVEELNEDGMPKKFKLKGVYQRSDTPNGNRRVYPRAVLEEACRSVNEDVANRRMLGELDHPDDAKIHLDKVSHLITKLEMNANGEMYGEAEVLPTANGKILESLLRSGVKLGISSRGFGSVKKNSQGLNEVQDDYKLVTFDIVSDPSTPGAFPNAVYENREEENENEEIEYVTTLGSLVEDVVGSSLDGDDEEEYRDYLCMDEAKNRFYVVEGEKDSYGYLNFHASHEYHVLVKNEDYQERLGLNEDNLNLIKNVYGPKVYKNILHKINDLGYDPKTLNLKKEEE